MQTARLTIDVRSKTLTALGTVTRFARRYPTMSLGIVIALFFLFVAAVGPSLTAYGPTKTNPSFTFESPSDQFPMGTDKFGRDILTRVIHATRLDFTIALTVAGSAFAIGSVIGGIVGYYGGTFH